jgi:uncharacterized protein (TIGR02145 family)
VNNVTIYGRLHNWYAGNGSRNIAPAGWHMPSDEDWQTLVDYLEGTPVAGGKMKETGNARWQSSNTGATNVSGFSALPGWYHNYHGEYNNVGSSAYFWSVTEDYDYAAWLRDLSYYS